MTQYELEVYVPGSVLDVEITYHSSHPFLAISAGDLINFHPELRRVVRVEHILVPRELETKHKVCVFTEAVENDEAARLQ